MFLVTTWQLGEGLLELVVTRACLWAERMVSNNVLKIQGAVMGEK